MSLLVSVMAVEEQHCCKSVVVCPDSGIRLAGCIRPAVLVVHDLHSVVVTGSSAAVAAELHTRVAAPNSESGAVAGPRQQSQPVSEAGEEGYLVAGYTYSRPDLEPRRILSQYRSISSFRQQTAYLLALCISSRHCTVNPRIISPSYLLLLIPLLGWRLILSRRRPLTLALWSGGLVTLWSYPKI